MLRHDFIVGLDYGESIKEVMDEIDYTLTNIDEILHAKELEPFVTIAEFATITINLKIHFWINSKDFVGSTLFLKSKVMPKVVVALIAKGVEMPAYILELKIYQEGKPIPIFLKKEL